MKSGYATQYHKHCIVLEVGDTIEDIIERAINKDALYQEGPDEEDIAFVVQFPGRPKELYSETALRRSMPIMGLHILDVKNK